MLINTQQIIKINYWELRPSYWYLETVKPLFRKKSERWFNPNRYISWKKNGIPKSEILDYINKESEILVGDKILYKPEVYIVMPERIDNVSLYFDTNEQMYQWIEDFKEKYGEHFFEI